MQRITRAVVIFKWFTYFPWFLKIQKYSILYFIAQLLNAEWAFSSPFYISTSSLKSGTFLLTPRFIFTPKKHRSSKILLVRVKSFRKRDMGTDTLALLVSTATESYSQSLFLFFFHSFVQPCYCPTIHLAGVPNKPHELSYGKATSASSISVASMVLRK